MNIKLLQGYQAEEKEENLKIVRWKLTKNHQ